MEDRIIRRLCVAIIVMTNVYSSFARDFATESAGANFFTSVESYGGGLRLSLFQNNQKTASLDLSKSAFDGFVDRRFGNFLLTKDKDDLLCYLHDRSLDVAYGFRVDFSGNISLSSEIESSTGVDRKVKYAFKTNGAIKNYNPVSFYALFADSEEIHNYSLLKTQDYVLRYRYFFNSGVMDLCETRSSTANIERYKEAGLMPDGSAAVPTYAANTLDNYGAIFGGSIEHTEAPVKINSYGLTAFDNIHFASRGSSLNVRGVFHVGDALSGKLDSITVTNVSDEVKTTFDVKRFDLEPTSRLRNEAKIFIRGDSKLEAREIINSGEITAQLSLDLSYSRLAGRGNVLVGNSLRRIKTIAGFEQADDASISASFSSMERLCPPDRREADAAVRNSNAEGVRHAVVERFRALAKLDSTLANISLLESKLEEDSDESFGGFGSANRALQILSEIGASDSEIDALMANPFSYGCMALDRKIADILRDFYEKDDDDRDEREIIKLISPYAVLWEYNMRRLAESRGETRRIFMEVWRRTLVEALSVGGERDSIRADAASGGGLFFLRADSLKVCAGIEGFSELVSRFGIERAAAVCDRSAGKRRFYEESFGFIRSFASDNGIRGGVR